MESETTPAKFTLWKQSSMAPEKEYEELDDLEEQEENDVIDIDPGLKLMYLVNGGDLDGIKELLESGVDVNFRDIDHRTALHVAACQGYDDVAQLLLENGAKADSCDRWGSMPLADAIHYKNHGVIKLLEKHGAKDLMAPMHVENAREVPEYEIDPSELDFNGSVQITKGTYRIALWRGTKVAVKTFWEGIADEDKVTAFRDELALLQKIRHPNVVQFLGAVTQSSPMMIVTEYLPKGDLHEYLKKKGSLKPATALRFAMDIARGMNYLHENKSGAIVHRDLEPSNILLDDSGHLKVADFGVSKLLKLANRIKEDAPLSCHDSSCRYVAPEVFRNEEYDTKVDVFSFALILQEMIEGNPPFCSKQDHEVPKYYCEKERPPFKASSKFYGHGLKHLIEECWSDNPADRPTFKQIIPRLDAIYNRFGHRRRWKLLDLIHR
ncbi:integrin-linked protein kinase 1-like isoform X2 [Salvia miltiorrhiza]|uniref:integrin-linked protein kinase 1-like isoform X2 n=1 Tax=Salvia miltiorrhiza TaxID=226208 RepID=UPI0025AB9A81|nr:integrin-linked protein kinase 1-like isoform X2 [Salvia miltiorrhiza]